MTFHFAMMVGRRGHWKEQGKGKERDRTRSGHTERGGRRAIVFALRAWEKGFPRSSSIYLSYPPEHDEAVVQEGRKIV